METEGSKSLSKIQTLPAELKLRILKYAANTLVVKKLVIACPSFYPVYSENKYTVLLNAYRRSQDRRVDFLAEIVLTINKYNKAEPMRMERAWKIWQGETKEFYRQDRVSFIDSKPSLSDLIEVSRMHCWVIEKAEEFCRMAKQPETLVDRCLQYQLFQDSYEYLYNIEVFAAIIDDRNRGRAAAYLPRSTLEQAAQYLWSDYDKNRMAAIVKVIWPNAFWKTPACRRRTRVLIVRNARRTQGTV